MVELLGTYTEENASQAREDAHKYVLLLLPPTPPLLLRNSLVVSMLY